MGAIESNPIADAVFMGARLDFGKRQSAMHVHIDIVVRLSMEAVSGRNAHIAAAMLHHTFPATHGVRQVGACHHAIEASVAPFFFDGIFHREAHDYSFGLNSAYRKIYLMNRHSFFSQRVMIHSKTILRLPVRKEVSGSVCMIPGELGLDFLARNSSTVSPGTIKGMSFSNSSR